MSERAEERKGRIAEPRDVKTGKQGMERPGPTGEVAGKVKRTASARVNKSSTRGRRI